MTQCEAFQLLAGASGLTGQTGASGQTGLTGEFRLWPFLVMYAVMISYQSSVQIRKCMWDNVRHCDCLQGRAALQA